MATNPYYTVTGAPVTQSRGVSATIRSEYSAIHTGFDAVYVAMLLRGLKGGETWTGTHVFTGANVTFATQSASDNSTKAATTAYADGAVATSAALKANLDSPVFTGTPTAPTAPAGTGTTQIATCEFVAATSFSTNLPSQTGNSGKFITTNGTTASWGLAIADQTGNSGKFLTTNGTTSSWLRVSPLPTVVVNTSSTTWTCPSNVTTAKVTVVGGGGSGSSFVSQAGGGGGGGGSAIKWLTVVPGTVYTVTIGAGGAAKAASSSSAGNAGGTSSFSGGVITTVSATGGEGGAGSTVAGAGGTGSNGDLNMTGGTGTAATTNMDTPTPTGGSSLLAGSSRTAGTGYGGGGSSIWNNGGSYAGAAGVVIIEY